MAKKKKKKESMEEKLYNLQAQQLAAQVANWAAQLEFQKERFRLLEMPQFQQGLQFEIDKFAWEKAQDTWERSYQEALLTGTYNGQPTTQWLMDQARLTGTFNGERTLEGMLTDAQIKDMQDKMKLANDQFLAATTGYFNGQKTFDREKFEAAQALEGWKFLATLSGPQNAFKQARAIASMPGGMNQMMQAFAGQYMLPSGAAVGSGGRASGQLSDLMLGFGGNAPPPPGGAPPPGAPPGGVIPPAGGGGPNPPPAAPPPTGTIPGRGFNPSQWNDATRQAAEAWMRSNPQYILDGSQVGYRLRTPSDPPLPPYAPAVQQVQQAVPAPQAAQAAATPDQYGAYPPPGTGLPGAIEDLYATGKKGGVTTAPGFTPDIESMPGITLPGMTYQPPGVQAPVNKWNYSGTEDGSVAVYPPGVSSPQQTPDVTTNSPINPASVSPMVNTPYQYGGVATPATGNEGLVNPNKLNAQNMQNAFQYQKELLWAGYEDAGWDKGLAQESYLRSLPKYGGVSRGAVAF